MDISTTMRPGVKAQAIIARDDLTMSGSMTPRYPFVMERGEGARVWDVDGNEYIDFAAGIAVNSTGHCHPRVVQAVIDQAQKFLHIAGTDYYYDVQVRTAERLAQLAPFEEGARVFLTNSGAEAVEGAIKVARWYTGRPHIIAFYGAVASPGAGGGTRCCAVTGLICAGMGAVSMIESGGGSAGIG
jgi:4-aminobutyrate aminotransferase